MPFLGIVASFFWKNLATGPLSKIAIIQRIYYENTPILNYNNDICLNFKKLSIMEEQNLMPFEGKPIRKIWHNDQWYFSIVDVIGVLTDSPIPKTYWSKLKKKISDESDNHQYPIWVLLKVASSDGRKRPTDCANTEGVFGFVKRAFALFG